MGQKENSTDDIWELFDDVLPVGGGFIVMLKAYLDRGAREDAGIMSVAVAVFKPIRYKPFCREWKQLLGPLPFLHATDFYSGAKGEDGMYEHLGRVERAGLAARIPGVIDRHVMQVVCVSFLEDEFNRVAPPNWRARFGSLHGVAVQVCLDALGHHFDRIGNRSRIAYFIETGDDDESHIDLIFKRVATQADRSKAEHWRYYSHTFVDKGAAKGLEVADNFAWHWDKFYAETLAKPIRDMRKDLRALIERNPNKYKVFPFHGEALGALLVSHGCTRPVAPSRPSDELASLPSEDEGGV